MDGLLLPILVVVTVILLGWGVYMIAPSILGSEKRKLQQRLSADRMDSLVTGPKSAVIQMEDTGLPPFLANHPLSQAFHRQIVQAFPSLKIIPFLGIVLGIAFVTAVTLWAIMDSVPLAIVAGGVSGYIPFFVLSSRRAGRQKLLENQLPEALDFLSRILRAGHSLTTGLQMMGDELPKPISFEFRRCYDQHSLGQSLEDCLKDMTTRIQSTDFAFFVTAILIQRQTGGDLSEVLTNISGMIRQRIRLQQHVKAKTAEGRFTGYILVAFPAVMFGLLYIMNPANVNDMLHTSSGIKMLGISFTLQMLGLWSIRKITTVRV